uniref:Immunoglobulin superfamily member 8 n=1 Tax=Sphenodon punctatus TaxID=8508 RepID=A0A8D0GW51_SPHPU
CEYAIAGLGDFWLLGAGIVLSGAREVHLPPGPLYRIEGTSISIPCNVSEYEGPTLQKFEWFVYRPAAPDISIGMVSTKDPKFPYAIFGPRVQSGDVSIHRVRGDAVELRIKQLRTEDAGIYECYTPTTDSKYHGSYSGKTELRVLPDGLWVSAASPGTKPSLRGRGAASPPLQLTLTESQELELSCTALSESQQHTHLSVSFGVSAPEAPVGRQTLQEVIGVRRDFAVETDGRYGEQHRAQELSLAKLGDQRYRMVLGRIRPEDAGTYHCTAGEWIQDPDGTPSPGAHLSALSASFPASQLLVWASPPELRLRSGDALEFLCNASGLPSRTPHAAYTVAWEVGDGLLVAQLDTEGVVVLGESYANREVGKRHISLQKLAPAPGSYSLRIESAQPGDVGDYRCVVRAYVRLPGAELQEVASAKSEPLMVHMKSEAVVLGVQAWLATPSIYRGDTAEVLCNISVDSTQAVRVAVGWWAEQEEEPLVKMVASVSREGVAELSSRASGGAVSVDKVGLLCHRLRIHGVEPSDAGRYHCAVTAWVRYPDQSWYNAGAIKSRSVIVYPYALTMDTLFIPLIVGVSSALFVGITVLVSVTCCFMARLRKR